MFGPIHPILDRAKNKNKLTKFRKKKIRKSRIFDNSDAECVRKFTIPIRVNSTPCQDHRVL